MKSWGMTSTVDVGMREDVRNSMHGLLDILWIFWSSGYSAQWRRAERNNRISSISMRPVLQSPHMFNWSRDVECHVRVFKSRARAMDSIEELLIEAVRRLPL